MVMLHGVAADLDCVTLRRVRQILVVWGNRPRNELREASVARSACVRGGAEGNRSADFWVQWRASCPGGPGWKSDLLDPIRVVEGPGFESEAISIPGGTLRVRSGLAWSDGDEGFSLTPSMSFEFAWEPSIPLDQTLKQLNDLQLLLALLTFEPVQVEHASLRFETDAACCPLLSRLPSRTEEGTGHGTFLRSTLQDGRFRGQSRSAGSGRRRASGTRPSPFLSWSSNDSSKRSSWTSPAPSTCTTGAVPGAGAVFEQNPGPC